MTELENKNGVPGMTSEPSKEEQSASLADKVQEFLGKGGKIKKPVNRRQKRAASGKSSKRKAAAVSSTGRKPVLTCWKMLNVKIGTSLVWTGKESKVQVSARVLDDYSMKMEVFYGKRKKVVDGLMRAEIFIKESMNLPVPKKPQGWNSWGLMDKKGKVRSVYSIYSTTDHKTLLNRRGY